MPVMNSPDHLGELAGIFRALTADTRLAIIELLADGRHRTVNELAEILDVPRSTLSYHLRILREVGITQSRHKGAQRKVQLRRATLDATYPGLLDALLQAIQSQTS
jgi:DNA-binding transcriptional ArsR family regulator